MKKIVALLLAVGMLCCGCSAKEISSSSAAEASSEQSTEHQISVAPAANEKETSISSSSADVQNEASLTSNIDDLLCQKSISSVEAGQIIEELITRAAFLLQNILDEPSTDKKLVGANGYECRLLPQTKYKTIESVQTAFHHTFAENVFLDTPLRGLSKWLNEDCVFQEYEERLYRTTHLSLPSLNQFWYFETAENIVIENDTITVEMDAERMERSKKTLKLLYENGRWVLTDSYFNY